MEFIKSIASNFQISLVGLSTALIQSILIFIFSWWGINRICKMFTVFLKKATSDISIVSFLDSLIKFSLRVLLIVTLLGYMGFNVTSLFAAIGASLVAIGISLKDNISNLVSGIILVITKPIHVGDYIEFENNKGKVTKIEMFFTTLQSDEKDKTVIIPNARLIANNIIRKSEYDFSVLKVNYACELFNAKFTEINKYLEKEFVLNAKILQIPVPQIEINYDDNGKLIIKLEVWCQNQHFNQVENDIDIILEKLSLKYKTKIKKKLN